MHGQAWAGRVESSSLGISQEMEIETGCGNCVARTGCTFQCPLPSFSALSELSSMASGPRPEGVAVEVFNVVGWLTHGDLALEAEVDNLVGCAVSGLG